MIADSEKLRQEKVRILVGIIMDKCKKGVQFNLDEFTWHGHTVVGTVDSEGTELSFDDKHRHFESYDEWIERGNPAFLCQMLLEMDPHAQVPLSLFRDIFHERFI